MILLCVLSSFRNVLFDLVVSLVYNFDSYVHPVQSAYPPSSSHNNNDISSDHWRFMYRSVEATGIDFILILLKNITFYGEVNETTIW